MKYLSLNVPDLGQVEAPPNVPNGPAFSLDRIITVFLSLFITVGVVLAVFFLIYGGFLWISSGGDKQKLDKARKTLLYSIMGIIIMALAIVIVNVIGAVLGAGKIGTR